MQAQAAPTELMFKLWPWLEANKNRLIGAAAVVVIIAGLYCFISWRHEQNEIAAGQALTQLLIASPSSSTMEQTADAFAQLGVKYSGTAAAQRATLQAAGAWFSVGKYADAQTEFQKTLGASSTGPLAASSELGLASSLEAQGKLDDAATAYHKVIDQFSDSAAALPAKFALGRIAEQQGKFTEASNYYQELARNNLAGSLASEAALRAIEIKSKLPTATKPAAQPVVPINK